ncbi:E3 ubiquitin-protein ligase MARCHF9 isoform X2 [Phyllopteryx taeniolatus]|uniref:E3 ubiquitin-protein ligase MARCHF9 isoform X2 n=1 Tax=Phyllopteryx taeniolatus TaxID=161469 RepID=UPI002AD4DDD2|nr:E3 ubiquitin-protein ligase MARCHF9 isoform X2 [Phyllopteryx taeniolatus]
MFKYRMRMFLNELKVLVSMRSDSSQSGSSPDPDRERRSAAAAAAAAAAVRVMGGCGWPPFGDCRSRNDDEEYYGSEPPRPRSQLRALDDKEPKLQVQGLDAVSLASTASSLRTPQCRICFQGPEQWQAISLTVIEKVQIAAIVLGSLFLIASISWLIWSSLSPSAKWQRQDLLFQICYGMYGFMDIVCIGLIIHEGSSVYRIFKRWQAVNQQWKVLNYEKSKDLGDPVSVAGKAGARGARGTPQGLAGGSAGRRGRRLRTILNRRCGYTILHILSQLRPNDPRIGAAGNREVVMRVTTV